jgi:hypothetical protein
MVLSEATLTTIVAGSVAIVAVIVNKLKCIMADGKCKSGCLNDPIVDNHEIEVKKATLNNIDFLYISKNTVDIDDNSDTSESSDDGVRLF